MKTFIKYTLVLYLLLVGIRVFGQNKCQPQNSYTTDSVGNENTSMKIPQRFIHKISEDRVQVFMPDMPTRPLIDFRIVKSACNEESKPGYYTIQLDLVLENKAKSAEPKYKIRCNYVGAYQIELLYPDSEERIFYINQQYFKGK